MSFKLDANWFTELCEEGGSAFSLKYSKKLVEEKTPFQKIEIYQTDEYGKLMVIDGFVMLTARDNFLYHEMMSHPVLFTHSNPHNVVIIGGGDCGTLREVLKHPGVEKLWQIEIDERVTRLAEEHFPELCESNNDPRVKLCFEDGILWMKNAEAGSIDIIIIDSTDPLGPAEGLFIESFYHDCFNVLADGGIIIHQSESPLLHLDITKSMIVAMKAAGFSETHTMYFPQPCYPTGWWSATMAAKNRSLKQFRESDAENKAFKTVYYNAEIHKGALAVPEFLKNQL